MLSLSIRSILYFRVILDTMFLGSTTSMVPKGGHSCLLNSEMNCQYAPQGGNIVIRGRTSALKGDISFWCLNWSIAAVCRLDWVILCITPKMRHIWCAWKAKMLLWPPNCSSLVWQINEVPSTCWEMRGFMCSNPNGGTKCTKKRWGCWACWFIYLLL